MVVANIQTKPLKPEAEKGSTRTACDRGLADPKAEINFEKECIKTVIPKKRTATKGLTD